MTQRIVDIAMVAGFVLTLTGSMWVLKVDQAEFDVHAKEFVALEKSVLVGRCVNLERRIWEFQDRYTDTAVPTHILAIIRELRAEVLRLGCPR